MNTNAVQKKIISWKNHRLDFSSRTYLMGILNVTPDSFYPGSRAPDTQRAVAAAEAMIEAGADIIDVGGESTRPGSEAVSLEEETQRVIPVIAELKKRTQIIVSVDTQKSALAERALDAGADMVNAVNGLREEDGFARLVARAGVPVVIMHMRGNPRTMQENPSYIDAVTEIKQDLAVLAAHARDCGVENDKIIIDPGIGFGKRLEDNLAILAHLSAFRSLGFPILIGLSRKSFIGAVLDRRVEERLAGTIAANTLAVLGGADILRVHDVAEARDAVRMVSATYKVF